MNSHPVIIACHHAAEAQHIHEIIGEASIPVYHKSPPLLERLSSAPDTFIIMTSLILDETAAGLLAKIALIAPAYSILYARHADHALDIMRLYGCGCRVIIGPEEGDRLNEFLTPDEESLEETVMPPFIVEHEEYGSEAHPEMNAAPVHTSFIGAQALMSFSNALLNIEVSGNLSVSSPAPHTPWARQRLEKYLYAGTHWKIRKYPDICKSCVTLYERGDDIPQASPDETHFIICHGHLSDMEESFAEDGLRNGARVFSACNEGYVESSERSAVTITPPDMLWRQLLGLKECP